jgi:hypothetical protein
MAETPDSIVIMVLVMLVMVMVLVFVKRLSEWPIDRCLQTFSLVTNFVHSPRPRKTYTDLPESR